MNSTICVNCEKQVTPAQHFCGNCGQSTHTHRFTLGHFFHEGFHAFTHADKGLLYLLKELAVRPGIVAREYIAGKRKKYFSPFTFFLILAAFYVFSESFKPATSVDKQPIPASVTKISDPTLRLKTIKRYERSAAVRVFFKKHGNIVQMIAVPVFAFFYWLIYYRKRYNYSEHLVANLMFVSFSNLAFSLIVVPLEIIFKGSHVASFIFVLGLLIQWFYFTMAYKGFLQLKGFLPNLKIFFSALTAIILWGFLNMIAMAIYIYQNAHFLDFFKYMMRR